MSKSLKQAALDYHENPQPGKISVEIIKSAETAKDLSLAYSPGVAVPVREIAKDPNAAYRYTGKGNLIAVISNGSAILGLGNLGALASKPVMEGKALLFKRFAAINAIDIEVDCDDPQRFIDIVKRISPSFGGINLEDIKAPECFEIEQALIEACDIPVFHDDQHGTSIVSVAGILNALEITGKSISDVRLVCMGAGAAAISCCWLLLELGLKRENLYVLDSRGVIHEQRTNLNRYKASVAAKTSMRTLDDVIENADIFLGLAGPDLLTAEQLQKMATNPVVFACSNPDPEINPDLAKKTRSDVIMATGRSDYPNQVNNVLGFPFIFRGALDVRAAVINDAMKIAAVHAIKDLAKEPVTQAIRDAYEGRDFSFGTDYILPKPMDSRLLSIVSAAVARAAVDSGVAKLDYPAHYPLV